LTVIHAQIKHCYTVHLALLTKSDLEDVSLQKLARLSLLKIIMVLSILRDEIMTVLCLPELYFHEAYYSICIVYSHDAVLLIFYSVSLRRVIGRGLVSKVSCPLT
jgi:hypothetical protein